MVAAAVPAPAQTAPPPAPESSAYSFGPPARQILADAEEPYSEAEAIVDSTPSTNLAAAGIANPDAAGGRFYKSEREFQTEAGIIRKNIEAFRNTTSRNRSNRSTSLGRRHKTRWVLAVRGYPWSGGSD
jgi:hypothetical protein